MKINQLIPDKKNSNKGTAKGKQALKQSLERLGAGRSILIDKNGQIIAGNKTIEQAKLSGFTDIEVIQSDGTKIIAVQRTDLDLDIDGKARELALADNRTGELDLEWDQEFLDKFMEELPDLDYLFEPPETQEKSTVEIHSREFIQPPKMTWILIGIPTLKFSEINAAIENLKDKVQICEIIAND